MLVLLFVSKSMNWLMWRKLFLCKALKRALKATSEQPPAPISDADVYVKTRKRKSTRTYKLPTEDVDKKVVSSQTS